jgi:hypothetical protein
MSWRKWADFVILTLLAGVIGITLPALREVILAAWTLLTLAYVLTVINTAARRLILRQTAFDRALAPRPRRRARPEDLERIEHSFGWRSYTDRDFDYEVRPLLRALARHGAARHGIDPAGDPAAKGSLLHPELVAVAGSLRADRLYGDTIRTAEIDRIVGLIEEL